MPEARGIDLTPFAAAPKPARTAPQRLVQMRTLSRDFSALTRNDKERRWELRLLPQPVFRYESTDPVILDGAVFAFVTSAGTDPEAILIVEARQTAASGEPAWHYAVGRFTDLYLEVRVQGQGGLHGPVHRAQRASARSQAPLPCVPRPVNSAGRGSGPMTPIVGNAGKSAILWSADLIRTLSGPLFKNVGLIRRRVT